MLVAFLVCAASGCGAGDAKPESAQPPVAAAPEPSAQEPAGRKLESLDLCALVPATEVAAALDARVDPQLAKKSSKGESSAMASNCWYWLQPEGSTRGGAEPYIVWVMPSVLYDREAENAERIAGLGDEAQIRFDDGEQQYRLTVLRRGDFALEVIGQERERTRRLADLVVARLDRQ
jgi:hypothetical protein